VPNPGGRLKSGLFAEGELLGGNETRRPALPAAVLTTVGRDADVFLAVQGIARRQRILVGPDQGGWRPVDGLAPGAQVVAQGQNLVVDGTPLRVAGTLNAEAGK